MRVHLTDDIAALLVRDLEGFQREISLFPDDGSVWRTLPGVTNSAGNLALHVAGNIQYFIGAVLGGSGYRRDRDRATGLAFEIQDRQPGVSVFVHRVGNRPTVG